MPPLCMQKQQQNTCAGCASAPILREQHKPVTWSNFSPYKKENQMIGLLQLFKDISYVSGFLICIYSQTQEYGKNISLNKSKKSL